MGCNDFDIVAILRVPDGCCEEKCVVTIQGGVEGITCIGCQSVDRLGEDFLIIGQNGKGNRSHALLSEIFDVCSDVNGFAGLIDFLVRAQ